ncbi:MAG: SDR family NAD(P)-dependent oxidoreductase [Acidimicrobiales bacterium]
MRELAGRVAVVTGGAGGIGAAVGERFAREGMRVVLADVDPDALSTVADGLRGQGLDVVGMGCDVADYASMEQLSDRVFEEYAGVHLLCNNAGIGAGAEGALWEHELNDWRWAFNVNVYGVIHGINAFVPAMVASGSEGHVVNTSSGNGGVAPLRGTPQYAVTKAAVVTLTECLYAQLQDAGSKVGASVLFPGPNMLRTGIFSSWRVRPPELAKVRPRQSAYPTIEDIEAQMEAAGVVVNYTEPSEVAEQVVRGVRDGRFWIMAPSDSIDAQIRARANSMLERANPAYLRDVPG